MLSIWDIIYYALLQAAVAAKQTATTNVATAGPADALEPDVAATSAENPSADKQLPSRMSELQLH